VSQEGDLALVFYTAKKLSQGAVAVYSKTSPLALPPLASSVFGCLFMHSDICTSLTLCREQLHRLQFSGLTHTQVSARLGCALVGILEPEMAMFV